MYPDWLWLLQGAVFVWLMILSFLIWQQSRFLRALFPKGGERDIRRKFEEVLKSVGDFRKELVKTEEKVSQLENLGLMHIQRVELSRYNPYEDTGGDQSFTLALLDDLGTGIVVTSLHARSGTRVFAKPVLQGKSGKYQFSKEEEQVIEEVMKQKGISKT